MRTETVPVVIRVFEVIAEKGLEKQKGKIPGSININELH